MVTQNRPIQSSNPGRPKGPQFHPVPQFLRSPRYPIDAGEEHLVPRLHADHAGQLRQGLDWGISIPSGDHKNREYYPRYDYLILIRSEYW